MDSIESKLNQLQVAFQEFYTSMGLEEVFKGAIDFATNLINQLNGLPKAFDKIPVAAIAMIGNLINALKSVAQLVFLPFYSSLRSFVRELETTVKIPPLKITFDKQQNQQAANEEGQQLKKTLEKHTKLTTTLDVDDKSTDGVTNWFKNNTKSLLVGIGSIVSAALSTTALTSLTGKVAPDATRESNKIISGSLGGLGNIVGGIVNFYTGNFPAMIGNIVGLVGNITTIFDGLDYNINEHRKAYEKEINELSNKSIEKNSEVKTLDQTIKKLEELTKARWSSNEANQEYLDFVNKVAADYPELVKAYDAEHNAVINSIDAYDELIRKKQEAADVDVELAKTTAQAAQLEVEYLSAMEDSFSPISLNFNNDQYNSLEKNLKDLGLTVEDLSKFNEDPSAELYPTVVQAVRDALQGSINPNFRYYLHTSSSASPDSPTDFILPPSVANPRFSLYDIKTGLDKGLFNQQNLSPFIDSNLPIIISNILKNDDLSFEKLLGTAYKDVYDMTSLITTYQKLNLEVTDWAQAEVEVFSILIDKLVEKQQQYNDALEAAGDSWARSALIQNLSQDIPTIAEREGISKRQAYDFTSNDNIITFIMSMIADSGTYRWSGAKNLSEFATSDEYKNKFLKTYEQDAELLIDYYNQLSATAKEQFIKQLGQAGQYASAELYAGSLGFDKNDPLYTDALMNWRRATTEIYEDALDLAEELPDDYKEAYKAAIGVEKDKNGNIIKANIGADFLASMNNSMEEVFELYNNGLLAQANERFEAIMNLWTSSADSPEIQRLIAGADLSSREGIRALQEQLKAQGLEDSAIFTATTSLYNTFFVNANTALQEYYNSLSGVVETAESTISNMTNGMSYKDLASETAKLQTLPDFKDATINDLFEYSSELGKYIYTEQGVQAATFYWLKKQSDDWRTARETLDKLMEAQKQPVDTTSSLYESYVKQLKDGAQASEEGFQEYISQQIIELNRVQEENKLAFQALLKSALTNDLSKETNRTILAAVVASSMGKETIDEEVNGIVNTIAAGGDAALTEYINLVGDAFDAETASIINKGQLGQKIEGITTLLNAKVGDVFTAEQVELYGLTKNLDNGGYVVKSADDMLAAARNLYQKIGKNFTDLASELDARDALFEASIKDDKAFQSALSDSDSLNLSAIREVEEALGKKLIDDAGNALSDYISRTGLESWAITDIEGFKAAAGSKIDNPYLQEALQAADRSMAERVINIAKAISEGSTGDIINVSGLSDDLQQALGATNGFLTLNNDQFNLIKVLQAESQEELSKIPNGMEQVADILVEYFKSLVSLISGGIEGNLTNVQKATLTQQAKANGITLNEKDFVKTQKGYKLTIAAALRLQSISDNTTYDLLVDSLKGSVEGYRTIAETLETQVELEEKLKKASGEEAKELERQLSLTRRIAQEQAFKDPSSYNFMNRTNTMFEGPQNYMTGVQTAIQAWSSFQNGELLDVGVLENMLTELDRIARTGGPKLQFAGVTLGEGAKSVTEALTQMVQTGLAIDASGNLGISFSKLGASFTAGVDDMAGAFEGGLKEVAQQNIDLIDAAIAMLETYEAIDKLTTSEVSYENRQSFAEQFLGILSNAPEELRETFSSIELELASGKKTLQGWLEFFADGGGTKEDFENFTNVFSKFKELTTDVDWSTISSDELTKIWKEATDEINKATKAAETYEQTLKKAHLADNIYAPNERPETPYTVDTSNWLSKDERRAKLQQSQAAAAPDEQEVKVKVEYSESTPAGLKAFLESMSGEAATAIETVIKLSFESAQLDEGGSPYAALFSDTELLRTFLLSMAQSPDPETQEVWSQLQNQTWYQDLLVKAGLDTEDVAGLTYSDGKFKLTDNITGGTISVKDIDVQGIEKVKNGWALTGIINGELGTLTVNDDTVQGFSYDIASASWSMDTVNGKISLDGLTDEEVAALNIPEPILDLIPNINTSTTSGTFTWDDQSKTLSFSGTVDGKEVNFSAAWDPDKDTPQKLIDAVDDNIPLTMTVDTDTAQTDVDNFVTANTGRKLQWAVEVDTSTLPTPNDLFYDDGTPKDAYTLTDVTPPTVPNDNWTPTTEHVDWGGDWNTITDTTEEIDDTTSNIDDVATKVDNTVLSLQQYIKARNAFDRNPNNTGTVYGTEPIVEKLRELITDDYNYLVANIGKTDTTVTDNRLQNILGTDQLSEQLLKDLKLAIRESLVDSYDKTSGTVTRIEPTLNNSDKANLGSAAATEEYKKNFKLLSKETQEGASATQTATKATEAITPEINSANSAVSNSARSFNNAAGASADAASNFKNVASSTSQVSNASGRAADAGNELSNRLSTASKQVENFGYRLGQVSFPSGGNGGSGGKITKFGKATGNVALAGGTQRTLMGELGPELWVSGGHYYVAGQNGAEFVDLPDDAIVFNHLQTRRLLGSGHSGRGTAVTNEKRATALAGGNAPKGPAHASRSDALDELYRLRALWQSILNLDASDLGRMAQGAGGGGGGGSDKEQAAVNAEIERWYNLLRQISALEKEITLEQKKRQNMNNGAQQYNSLQDELKLLDKQIAAQTELNKLRSDWYNTKRGELERSEVGRFVYTYDDRGLQQYRSGSDRGVDLLEKLVAKNDEQDLEKSASEQLEYLKSIGFNVDILAGESDADKVSDFFNRVDSYKKELDGLWDDLLDGQGAVEDAIKKQTDIEDQIRQDQIDLEQKVYDAIVEREERRIQDARDERDALAEANDKFIEGLTTQLNQERRMYDANKASNELLQLQRQLAILQRSGGSASSIRSLQEQINTKEEENYFQMQQDQIDAVKEASDLEIERLDNQIEIMEETLEYQKENGLLWMEVNQILQGTPEEIANFILQNNKQYLESSATQQEEFLISLQTLIDKYVANRDADKINAQIDTAWGEYSKGLYSRYTRLFDDSEEGQARKQRAEEIWKVAYRDALTKGNSDYDSRVYAKNFLYDNYVKDEIDRYWARKKSEESSSSTEAEKKKEEQSSSGSGGGSGSGSGGGSTTTKNQSTTEKEIAEQLFQDLANNTFDKFLENNKWNEPKTAKTLEENMQTYRDRRDAADKSLQVEEASKEKLEQVFQLLTTQLAPLATSWQNNAYAAGNLYGQINKQQYIIDHEGIYDANAVAQASSKKAQLEKEHAKPYNAEQAAAEQYKDIIASNEILDTIMNQVANNQKLAYDTVVDITKKIAEYLAAEITKINSTIEDLNTVKARMETNIKTQVTGYDEGGLVNYTGLAMVHGSKSHPEAFFSADTVESLKEMMLQQHQLNYSLAALMQGYNEAANNTRNVYNSNTSSNEGVYIENATVQISSDVIANDYDAQRAGNVALDEMMRIARRNSTYSASRR